MTKSKDKVETIKKVAESYLCEHGIGKGQITSDHVTIFLLDRLDRGTKSLNCLSIVLIVLTGVLAVLTAILVCQVNQP